MSLNLYLVRGHDVEGENQDAFVVAKTAEDAVPLWNDWCRENGLARNWDVEDEDDVVVQPQGARLILEDVSSTAFGGRARFVDWDELPEMLDD